MRCAEYRPLMEAANTSMATIRRVLNHKENVDPKTRERVLRLALEKNVTIPSDPVDVYVILPHIPAYFWKTLYQNLCKQLTQSELKVSYHFCDVYNKDYFLQRHYLEDALACGAKAIFLATSAEPQFAKVLKEYIGQCPIFLLCNGENTDGAYYFWMDYYGLGKQLADECNQNFPNGNVVVVGNPISTGGFISNFSGNSIAISLNNVKSKTFSAQFARQIHEISNSSPLDAIICFDGITEKICLALQKARMDIHCYGMEYTPFDVHSFKNRKIPMTYCHDLPSIAKAATVAVEKYLKDGTLPLDTNTYIPPLCIQNRKR